MKEINKKFLNNIEQEYLNDQCSTITRRALVKNKINDLAKVNEQAEFTRDMFSINLKTLPVTNQKSSGRCWIFAGCNVIREKVAKKYNLKDFELSQNYIAFYDKIVQLKINHLIKYIQ